LKRGDAATEAEEASGGDPELAAAAEVTVPAAAETEATVARSWKFHVMIAFAALGWLLALLLFFTSTVNSQLKYGYALAGKGISFTSAVSIPSRRAGHDHQRQPSRSRTLFSTHVRAMPRARYLPGARRTSSHQRKTGGSRLKHSQPAITTASPADFVSRGSPSLDAHARN
jgi:hypothetical protein